MATHPLRWTTLVALERADLPPFERVAAAYAEQFPDAPPLAKASGTDNLLTITIGDDTAAATLVPRSIPPGQLAGPAATAWYWRTAEAELSGHEAHLLVTLVDEGGKPVEKALALTRLTAALVATSPSVGIFWGPGRLVHPPGAFIDQAANAGEHNLPLFLWVDFRVERDAAESDGGELRLFTTGLEALGAEEIEVADYVGAPGELVGFVYNVAHYMLERRKVINDGDTIGLTDAVQVTARRGPSNLGGELEVVQLEFERG
jgi:hypothetical protein